MDEEKTSTISNEAVEEEEKCTNNSEEGDRDNSNNVKRIIDGIFQDETILTILNTNHDEEDVDIIPPILDYPEVLQTPEYTVSYDEDEDYPQAVKPVDHTSMFLHEEDNMEEPSSCLQERLDIVDEEVVEWMERLTSECFTGSRSLSMEESADDVIFDVSEFEQSDIRISSCSTPSKSKKDKSKSFHDVCSVKLRPVIGKIIDELKRNSELTNNKRLNTGMLFDIQHWDVLEQQMQMHVQLLTQTNLLCKNSKEHKIIADESSNLLSEISQLKHVSCDCGTVKSAFDVCNLNGAIDFCEKTLAMSKPVSTLPKVLEKRGYVPIPKSMAKLMAHNTAFMYVDLLPVSNIIPESLITVPFSSSEDNLIAMNLHALKDVTDDPASLMPKLSLPIRDRKTIKIRIKNAIHKDNNPIKEYLKLNIFPKPDSSVEFVNEMKKPINRTYSKSMPYWLEALHYQRQIKKLTNEQMNQPSFIPFLPTLSTKMQSSSHSIPSSSMMNVSIHNSNLTNSTANTDSHNQQMHNPTLLQPTAYLTSIVINPNTLPKAPDKPTAHRKILPNIMKDSDVRKSTGTSDENSEVMIEEMDDADTNNDKEESLDELETEVINQIIAEDFNPCDVEAEDCDVTTTSEFDNNADLPTLKRKNKSKASLRIKLFKTSAGHKTKRAKPENAAEEIEEEDNIKDWEENVEVISEIDSDPLKEEKEQQLALNYMKNVQEVFKDQPTQYKHFLELMNRFTTANESAVKLYNQLKHLFKDHDDLVSAFVPFLLPQQALECGVYKEYFVYQLAKKFLRKLEIEYKDNFLQMEKILMTLCDIDNANITCESDLMRSVSALLKDKPELQESLLMFFGEERVPDSFFEGKFEEVFLDDDLKEDSNFYAFENVGVGRKINQSKHVFVKNKEVMQDPTKKNDTPMPSANSIVQENYEDDLDENNLDEDDENIVEEEDDIIEESDLDPDEEILSNDEENLTDLEQDFLDNDECRKEACDLEGLVDLHEFGDDEEEDEEDLLLPCENGFDNGDLSLSESEASMGSAVDEEVDDFQDENNLDEQIHEEETNHELM